MFGQCRRMRSCFERFCNDSVFNLRHVRAALFPLGAFQGEFVAESCNILNKCTCIKSSATLSFQHNLGSHFYRKEYRPRSITQMCADQCFQNCRPMWTLLLLGANLLNILEELICQTCIKLHFSC
jgi:hypothetical protein